MKINKLLNFFLFFLLVLIISIKGNAQDNNLFIETLDHSDIDLLIAPTIIRARVVKVNFELLPFSKKDLDDGIIGRTLTLPLFYDVELTAILSSSGKNARGKIKWKGYVNGIDNSHVIFVYEDQLIVGNISVPGAFYQVRSGGDGVHIIRELDHSKFDSCGTEDKSQDMAIDIKNDNISGTMADSGGIIDVMVVYNTAARVGSGSTASMEAEIDLAIIETNQGYANSGVTQRVNLVHTVEVDYIESGSIFTDKSRLENKADGYMDNIHTLRNTFGADCVALITEGGGGYCGVASLITIIDTSQEYRAFCVVKRSCATGYYSFGHELGHIMAARHDRYVDNTDYSPYTYNHGYTYNPASWRTIMAYNNACSPSCTRLNYWSNPGVLYGGIAMGDPGGAGSGADNHLTLNNTAYTVANFRQTVIDTLTIISPNGGDIFAQGDTKNITWLEKGTIVNIKLEYSINNGSNWTDIIVSTPNDGTYQWTVPNLSSSLCLVRSSNVLDPSINDVSDTTFTITAPFVPTVTTQNVSNILVLTATGNGNITSLGAPDPTSHGVCWSTSPNPSISDSLTDNGTAGSTGAFTSNMTGLTANTFYYVRAYATNAAGTFYGNEVTFTTSSPISTSERSALIALYNSTNGDSWTDNSGWKTAPLDADGFAMPGTEGSWNGVYLTNDYVEYLYLYYNNLTGLIPTELGDLNNLIELDLFGNLLTGSIPSGIGNLSSLEWMDLSDNQLTGSIPPEIGNLNSLIYFWLCENQLSGSIPPEMGNLSNLEWMDLDNNLLTGSIPPELGNLSSLSYLELYENQLSGSIPPELGNLSNLEWMDLDNNLLTGNIPPELGNLSSLSYLELYENQLSGSIPPELGNLSNLEWMDLDTNLLTGSIPPELGNLSSLSYLELYYNQLSGTIPPELGNLSNLSGLDLDGNFLSGSIPPEIGNLSSLTSIWLSSNMLSGSIPTEIGNLSSLNTLRIDYNSLFSNDSTLTIFLNIKDPEWADTQTIIPDGISAITASYSSVNISWIPIVYTGDTGGYMVYYSSNSGGPFTYSGITADKSATSYIVNGLNPETTYYFVVKTWTDSHISNQSTLVSEYSLEVSATTSPVPIITVISPNGGESVQQGSSYNISWSSSNLTNDVKITLWKDGFLIGLIVKDIDPDSGSYNWSAGSSLTGIASAGTGYKIKIREQGGVSFTTEDDSDASFSLTSGRIIVVASPNGGESLQQGSSYNISWSSNNLTNDVKITLWKDGSLVGLIVKDIDPDSGSYNWSAGSSLTGIASAGTGYKIKIREQGGASFTTEDDSDVSFSLTSGRIIVVASPNGGESLQQGSSYNISWSSGNLTNDVKITLWKDGSLVGLIVKDIDPDSGSYNWTAGSSLAGIADAGTGYKIKIREQGGVSFTTEDDSDASFSLTSGRIIVVASPNGGESLQQGSSYNISWSSGNLTNDVKITLWKDGSLVGLIVKDIDPASGSYIWTAGSYSGGTVSSTSGYKIKIREQGGATYITEDISDGSFNLYD